MTKDLFTSVHVRLRAMEPSDLDFLYRIENDPDSWDVSNFSVPYSRHLLSRYIESSENDMFADRQLRLIVTLRSSLEAIGTVDLTDFSPQHHHAEVGIALLRQYRGMGYAREALELLENYAFLFLHMKHLTARSLVSNESSLGLFRSLGYRQAGLLTSWWLTEDGYQDVVLLEKVRS